MLKISHRLKIIQYKSGVDHQLEKMGDIFAKSFYVFLLLFFFKCIFTYLIQLYL